MSTRSAIGIKNKDGSVNAVYCHFDGYPAHNGKLLKRFFPSIEGVQYLLDSGPLTCIEENGNAVSNKNEESFYVFFLDEKDFLDNFKNSVEWFYLFDSVKYKWRYAYVGDNKFKILSDRVIKDDENGL